jgi:hypothetical protein
LGLDLDNELVLAILGLVGTYVIGQGIADNGKEAAKLELNDGKPPSLRI